MTPFRRGALLITLGAAVMFVTFVAGLVFRQAPLPQPTPTRIPSLDFNATPMGARQIRSFFDLYVHPIPNGSLTLEEYQRGIVRQGYRANPPRSYNICIDLDMTVRTRMTCIAPDVPLTPAPAGCRDYKNPPEEIAWRNTEITLDGQQLNDGHLASSDTLKYREDFSVYSFCYRIPLQVGTHRMTYHYRWDEDQVEDSAQWEFTVRP